MISKSLNRFSDTFPREYFPVMRFDCIAFACSAFNHSVKTVCVIVL